MLSLQICAALPHAASSPSVNRRWCPRLHDSCVAAPRLAARRRRLLRARDATAARTRAVDPARENERPPRHGVVRPGDPPPLLQPLALLLSTLTAGGKLLALCFAADVRQSSRDRGLRASQPHPWSRTPMFYTGRRICSDGWCGLAAFAAGVAVPWRRVAVPVDPLFAPPMCGSS